MTFAEWVAVGAAIGCKAFAAVVVFLLCCMAVLGILSVITTLVHVLGGHGDDMDRD